METAGRREEVLGAEHQLAQLQLSYCLLQTTHYRPFDRLALSLLTLALEMLAKTLER